MKKRQGFTLVELLVVMAIIAILASIVVPNVASYIRKSRMTAALSEIQSIELALTKMLADADRGSLNNIFVREKWANDTLVGGMLFAVGGNPIFNFEKAIEIYTRTIYALLRDGRAALGLSDDTGFTYASVLDQNAVRKLGTNYLDIEFDPWGNLYNIVPGPWPSTFLTPDERGQLMNFFRVYMRDDNTQSLPGRGIQQDGLTFSTIDPETDQSITIGYPAPRNPVAFIWSSGQNLVSGQAIYTPLDIVPRYIEQEEELMGGGDDINNWDNGRSWERFYN
jgi:prepilin-type N-terminal cleavage/methylation domain-containing protein